MKILLYCPTYEKKGIDQFWPDSRESFEAIQAPDGVEVVRVVGRDNPYDIDVHHRYRNTLHQFQNAQRMALEGGFDALCTFESDMIVPADGLIKLWETPADVVYGLYLLRHGSNVLNAFRLLVGSPNIDQSISLFPELYAQGMKEGSLRVSGCGNGFTLIRRPVLERFPLRNWDEVNYAPDWALATDCQRAGIEQVCRFDVLCGHIEETGLILWPGRSGPMVRVKVLQNFTRGAVYHAGEEAEMPEEDYPDMSRAGFVTLLEENDEPVRKARPRVLAVEEAVIQPPEKAVKRRKREGR